MKNLKYLLSFALLLTFSAMSFAGDVSRSQPTESDGIVISQLNENVALADENFGRDCTVNVNVTLEDGTVVSGTIVIEDISWIRCAAIHVADFFSNAF